MEDIQQLLNDFEILINGHLAQLFSLLGNNNIKNICHEYEHNAAARKVDIGLNLFALISEIYHRENFHSDILKLFLDSNGKHNEGDKYLQLFLDLLRKSRPELKIGEYKNSVIFREKGRIDLLICDENSKTAIIIENKINNAVDMERQLPRYLEDVTSKGYTCEAIVYLRLNKKSHPSTDNWKDEDFTEVSKRLIEINACDESNLDLLNGWIYKAEKQTTHIDALLILRQYGTLIKHLGGNVMNKEIMEKFYAEMLKGENYKTALSLTNMMSDMPKYRLENIVKELKKTSHPFVTVKILEDFYIQLSCCQIADSNLTIDIGVYDFTSTISIWDVNYNSNEVAPPFVKKILRTMGYENEFYESEGYMNKDFQFPSQETELLQFIEAFNKKLSTVLPALKAES